MKYTLKNIIHADLLQKLNGFASELETLLAASEKKQGSFIKKSEELRDTIIRFLQESIKHDATHTVAILNGEADTYEDYIFRIRQSKFEQQVDRIAKFTGHLRLVIGYLSVSDSLKGEIHPKIPNNIPEKTDYLLTKLDRLFDDYFYSIQQILTFNNIAFRHNEPTEMAEDLARRGYVKIIQRGARDKVQLTVKGAGYIQRKTKSKSKPAPNRKEKELDEKLDQIILQLTKLGFGQEIIFNEIEELRALQHTLSKKTWGQLLKGKLLDLAIESVINKDTAKFIYEYLTSTHLKLIDFK
jgi:hypothetical protein